MFLAFPLNGKPDWRNPPWLTVLLILVNCLIYFGPQRSEEKAWDKAVAYYAESGMRTLEFPGYFAYLRQRGDRKSSRLAEQLEQQQLFNPGAVLHALETDHGFQEALHAGRIVRADDPGYAAWHEQRRQFERLKGPPFTARWAVDSAALDPWTLLSATFLHGSVAHLLGNMVFLFLFGYTVEVTLGRVRYLAYYLIAGVAGWLGHLLSHGGEPGLALGASGAISGLMAMYVVLYGRRRIQFFYQFLFYFDYVRAPAIVLLPVWIVHELMQNWLSHGQGVAYLAHAGGLISGALLVAWHKWRHPQTRVALPEVPPDDGFDARLAQADALMKAVNMDGARVAYRRLLDLRPNDRAVLLKLFHVARHAPDSTEFHWAASRLLALPESDDVTEELIRQSFRTYWQSAKPRPRLSANLMARLAGRFARAGHTDDAARLVDLLMRLQPDHDQLPSVLLALVQGELRRNRRQQAVRFGERLAAQYGDSAEARLAADLLA